VAVAVAVVVVVVVMGVLTVVMGGAEGGGRPAVAGEVCRTPPLDRR